MPRGQTSYMLLSDFSTGDITSLALAGAVTFCIRPPAANPNWILIATDAGEIRVFDKAGAYKSAHDIDLGWNPDQVAINNETPPKILIRRHSTLTIYLYESGSESWNVAGITSMREALISDGWVHTLLSTGVAGTCGPEWRSLTDGSIDTVAPGGSKVIAGGLAVTEAGESVFWINHTNGAVITYFYKHDRTQGQKWVKSRNNTVHANSYYERFKSSADGSLAIATYGDGTGANAKFIRLFRGSDGFDLYTVTGQTDPIIEMNPGGTRAMYIVGSTLHKLTSAGAESNVALGAIRVANDYGGDVTDDPHFIAALVNSDLEIYDDSLVKKATIAYDLSDSPVAVIRNT